jgi:hypothetical protein
MAESEGDIDDDYTVKGMDRPSLEIEHRSVHGRPSDEHKSMWR